jgi:flagellar biosynthesis/type III secretory pathway protein FliH
MDHHASIDASGATCAGAAAPPPSDPVTRLSRVMPASELPAWQSERALLQHAQAQARRLLDEARGAAEQARAEAHRKRHAAGLAEAKASCASQLVALKGQQALGWQRGQPSIAQAVGACFARLVGAAAMPDHLSGRLQALLGKARPRGKVRIRVPGSCADRVRELVAGLRGGHPEVELFRIVADNALAPDDLVIETRAGVVDGRLEAQVAAIRRGLAEALGAAAR